MNSKFLYSKCLLMSRHTFPAAAGMLCNVTENPDPGGRYASASSGSTPQGRGVIEYPVAPATGVESSAPIMPFSSYGYSLSADKSQDTSQKSVSVPEQPPVALGAGTPRGTRKRKGSRSKTKTGPKPSSLDSGSQLSTSAHRKVTMMSGQSKKRSLEITIGPKQPVSKVSVPVSESGELSYCPLSFCDSSDKRLKRHVMKKHFPKAMKAMASNSAEVGQQLEALRWLIHEVLGQRATLQDAVEWVNLNGGIPSDVSLLSIHDGIYRDACGQLGIEAVKEFTLHPVNSPAVLLFWRCVLAFLVQCSVSQCENFSSYQAQGGTAAVSKSTCNSSLVQYEISDNESDLEEFVLQSNTQPSGYVQQSEVEVFSDAPQVFDSHFHLDRTSQKIWKTSKGHTVEELISYSYSSKVSYQPAVRVNVVGGIIVHSEPKTYPEVDFTLKGPWRVAVGVHPEYFDTLTTENYLTLQRLLSHPKVVALGDCGLDRTLPVVHWSQQENVFRRMLRLARAHQPLVIHLRGPQGDKYGSDVHGRCLMLMEELCDRTQKVHVHCFKGKEDVVRAWLRKFPNSYFGITAAVCSFDQVQIEGLRAIPQNRLLLETDAPYFPLGNASVSTPAYLGEVAAFISVHLDLRPPELMQATLKNAQELYNL